MNERSPLMRLSRELRDIIYEYALYEPKGLFVYRDQDYKATFCCSRRDHADFNQLKYVCRQLYHETHGLERRLNELVPAGVFRTAPRSAQDAHRDTVVRHSARSLAGRALSRNEPIPLDS